MAFGAQEGEGVDRERSFGLDSSGSHWVMEARGVHGFLDISRSPPLPSEGSHRGDDGRPAREPSNQKQFAVF